jgi:hypothetical protein
VLAQARPHIVRVVLEFPKELGAVANVALLVKGRDWVHVEGHDGTWALLLSRARRQVRQLGADGLALR